MSTAKWLGVALLVLVTATGCAKKKSSNAETCERFGDAAGRCTVGAIEGRALLDGAASHAGIRVSLVGTDRAAVTGDDGAFAFEKLPPGDYVVALEADGYVSTTAGAPVRERHATTLAPVTLLPSSVATRVGGRFLLGGRADHAGTMVSLDGTGVAVFTDGDGSFAFADIPHGVVRITARRSGFVDITVDVEVDRGVVDAGDHTLDPLPAPGDVAGLVTAEGAPLEGVVVALAGTEFEARTGADGAFRIESADPGSYELLAVSPGYTVASRQVVIEPGRATAVPAIDLEPAMDAGNLQGFARRLGAANHAGIEVRLQDGEEVLAIGLTDGEGAYRLPAARVGIHTLVLRAPGFPELRMPGVALGPGDWLAPTATLRRSVRIDSRWGRGVATPSGRKAVTSYYSGRYGTFLWDGDSLTQRFVLPGIADLVAVDRDERFATLADDDDEEGRRLLTRLDLQTGASKMIQADSTRLIGSYGASTFFQDRSRKLHRLLAKDTVATPVEGTEGSYASIQQVDGDIVWVELYRSDWTTASIPFDAEGDWVGPQIEWMYGPGPDRFIAFTSDLGLVWMDLARHVVTPIEAGEIFNIVEVQDRVLLLENFRGTGAFDVRSVRFDDGAIDAIAQDVVDLSSMAGSIYLSMLDGSIRWLANDGASTTTIELCAGGDTESRNGFMACRELTTGVLRIGGDAGVRTVAQSASSFQLGDGFVEWTEPAGAGVIHLASLETLHDVPLSCDGDRSFLSGEPTRVAVACDDGLRFVDLESETVTTLSAGPPVSCSVGPGGATLVCLFEEACGAQDHCARAFDLRRGLASSVGVDASWVDPIAGANWIDSGLAASAYVDGHALQVVFPDTGAPQLARCDLPEAGWVLTQEGDGSLLWTTWYDLYVCDDAGNPAHVGSAPLGWYGRLGDSGWVMVSGAYVVNPSRGAWVAVSGWGDWWISPSGDVFLVDDAGLRRLSVDGSITSVATDVMALASFEYVPLLRDATGVFRLGADGTLGHVVDAQGIDASWLDPWLMWFIAWGTDGEGSLFVYSVADGSLTPIATGVDPTQLHVQMDEALYFGGVVGDVEGFYRFSVRDPAPVPLVDRAMAGFASDHVFLFDHTNTWVVDGDEALLVHDEPVEQSDLERPWARGFVFHLRSDASGTWWFTLP